MAFPNIAEDSRQIDPESIIYAKGNYMKSDSEWISPIKRSFSQSSFDSAFSETSPCDPVSGEISTPPNQPYRELMQLCLSRLKNDWPVCNYFVHRKKINSGKEWVQISTDKLKCKRNSYFPNLQ